MGEAIRDDLGEKSSEAKQSEAKRSKAKQSEAKRSKAKQSEAKQAKQGSSPSLLSFLLQQKRNAKNVKRNENPKLTLNSNDATKRPEIRVSDPRELFLDWFQKVACG